MFSERIDVHSGEGGVNMVAVPKERGSELSRFSRSDFMDRIDVAGGRFYIQNYDVSMCLVDTGCVVLRHAPEENNMCGGSAIREEDINFWQTL